METKKNIEAILNSLDGIQKASPGAFFYTRVKARINREKNGFWVGLSVFLTKPVVAFSTFCLIGIVNGSVFFYHTTTSKSREQTDQVSTEEYNTTLAINSYYDENPDIR